MRLFIIALCLLMTGCASEIYKGGCGNLVSTKNTVPYTFGTADGGAYGCYMAYFGKNKAPDYEPIKAMMTSYFTTAGKSNTLALPDGGTVVYVPSTTKK